ncbi:MAG: RrF2 family transcriptional regulator [Verrucomicrobiota bacterium]
MKLSLKTEYACRVLAQLSRSYGQGRPIHVEALAEAEAIPSNYLVQILNELRNGGLIGSRRGKQGGYFLAVDPAEVTLYSIIKVLDGDLLEVKLQQKGESGPRVAEAWQRLATAIKEEAEKITLNEMASGNTGSMYYI